MKQIDFKGQKWVNVTTFIFDHEKTPPVPIKRVSTMRAFVDGLRVEVIKEEDLETKGISHRMTIGGDTVATDSEDLYTAIEVAEQDETPPSKPKPQQDDVDKVIDKLTGTKDGTQTKT